MAKSSKLKRRDGNVITKNMMKEKMEEMATLMTVMEATLMEWEIWYRLIKTQKESLTQEQFNFFVLDGPIFTELTGKIMESVRSSIPEVKLDDSNTVQKKPTILGADGLPVIEGLPKILDASGHTPNPLG